MEKCSFVSDPKDVDESLKIVYNLVKLEDHYLADRVEVILWAFFILKNFSVYFQRKDQRQDHVQEMKI